MMKRSEGFFEGYQDLQLFFQVWEPEKPSRGLLVVTHGQGEHSECYHRLVSALADLQWTILGWGMIWSFRETGRFFRRDLPSDSGAVELDMKTIAHAGTPTPQYLPDYVRSILREFFRDQGVIAPKILVLSQDRINYELAFSLESLGNPPASEHAGVAEAISWFLPPHYPVILVSEKGLPQFGPL